MDLDYAAASRLYNEVGSVAQAVTFFEGKSMIQLSIICGERCLTECVSRYCKGEDLLPLLMQRVDVSDPSKIFIKKDDPLAPYISPEQLHNQNLDSLGITNGTTLYVDLY